MSLGDLSDWTPLLSDQAVWNMPGARMLRVIGLIGKKWRYCGVQGSAYWM